MHGKVNPESHPILVQGGKYVGFGSAGSAPPRPPQNGGIDQVTTMLSTGWNQLSTAAGARRPADHDGIHLYVTKCSALNTGYF